ncbi:30S ribosome-binding factor RbfA [Criibacterium bergeronii]|uniref:Ribosome-binding factor A n=1 Tax=Criibacterium bergeronii TaxID=1871336 RepID=A0A371IKS4_9FIRM|nr:30S ribosome-binding factor RbfA [Criibacterium bergeronii]MBS6063516.1 30S ribosome-binding factor RbfA [Peptostreptococcaceae bacterium]RDY21063.1 30S ribosome-binding factor RbfA [Criibacterium bergeronii]TRW28376.1 30S ribosome-binding factor RbfA [Criibacterium bergeronii]
MKFERTQRIEQEIKKVITQMLIEGHIKNTVITETTSLISIVDVRVVTDLKYAYVYVSVLGGNKDEIVAALQKSAGFIRSQIGKRVKLRYTPELIFERDDTIKTAIEMMEKINKVHHDDEEKELQAAKNIEEKTSTNQNLDK